MVKVIDAVILASRKHEGQERKDGTPYIYHPLMTARMVAEAGYDERYIITALLHDVLEDTDTTEDEIRDMFGEEILEALRLVTRPPGMPEEEYVAGILKNDIAAAVKNADKIHNLHELLYTLKDGEKTNGQTFAERYLEKSRKYYQGKFSKDLDLALDEAESRLRD